MYIWIKISYFTKIYNILTTKQVDKWCLNSTLNKKNSNYKCKNKIFLNTNTRVLLLSKGPTLRFHVIHFIFLIIT